MEQTLAESDLPVEWLSGTAAWRRRRQAAAVTLMTQQSAGGRWAKPVHSQIKETLYAEALAALRTPAVT